MVVGMFSAVCFIYFLGGGTLKDIHEEIEAANTSKHWQIMNRNLVFPSLLSFFLTTRIGLFFFQCRARNEERGVGGS